MERGFEWCDYQEKSTSWFSVLYFLFLYLYFVFCIFVFLCLVFFYFECCGIHNLIFYHDHDRTISGWRWVGLGVASLAVDTPILIAGNDYPDHDFDFEYHNHYDYHGHDFF